MRCRSASCPAVLMAENRFSPLGAAWKPCSPRLYATAIGPDAPLPLEYCYPAGVALLEPLVFLIDESCAGLGIFVKFMHCLNLAFSRFHLHRMSGGRNRHYSSEHSHNNAANQHLSTFVLGPASNIAISKRKRAVQCSTQIAGWRKCISASAPSVNAYICRLVSITQSTL